jgi:hypothetical protein
MSEQFFSSLYTKKMEFEMDGRVTQWLKKFLEAQGAALAGYSCS